MNAEKRDFNLSQIKQAEFRKHFDKLFQFQLSLTGFSSSLYLVKII
jgi:hypothetical protein